MDLPLKQLKQTLILLKLSDQYKVAYSIFLFYLFIYLFIYLFG